ncbi:MAG: cell division protein FtsL [Burkholderiaceae bacterium]
MTRLSIVLLAALMFSAMYLVKVQYESRQLVTQIERARSEARTLATQRRQLEVEKRAQATSLRVERLAQDKLAMRPVTPAITEYVTQGPARSAPAAAGSRP